MKIDYVIPYVDCDDKCWQKLYSQYSCQNLNSQVENKRRFDTNYNLKYIFRGIAKHMPWINNVWLIVQTDSQVPYWIDRHNVKIAYHNQFIPKEHLPTFNSCTIECFLHNIEGLSETFVYGNDDMFILNDVKSDELFDLTTPKNALVIGKLSSQSSLYMKHIKKCTDIVLNKLSIAQSNNYYVQQHVQTSFSKTMYKKIFELCEDEIMQSLTRFRDECNISQTLFVVFQCLLFGKSYKRKCTYVHHDIIQNFEKCKDEILKTKPQFYCLNNNDNNVGLAMMQYFNQVFPDKSQFEL